MAHVIPEDDTIHYSLEVMFEQIKNLYLSYTKGDISAGEYYTKHHKYLDIYTQAMKLLFSKPELSFCDLMPVEQFAEAVENGGFTSYDGVGDYLDFEGNDLEVPINWNYPFDYPDKAVFVAWYNK
jgi:hypothetical protein